MVPLTEDLTSFLILWCTAGAASSPLPQPYWQNKNLAYVAFNCFFFNINGAPFIALFVASSTSLSHRFSCFPRFSALFQCFFLHLESSVIFHAVWRGEFIFRSRGLQNAPVFRAQVWGGGGKLRIKPHLHTNQLHHRERELRRCTQTVLQTVPHSVNYTWVSSQHYRHNLGGRKSTLK